MLITMTQDLMAQLRCPRCRGEMEIVGDPPRELTCPSCSARQSAAIPIVGAVPRLAAVPDSYAASFGRQWNRYDVARPEEDEATFLVKTGVHAADLAGQLVLDAGCGGGRYARLLGSHGARVIGVDLSAAVEQAARLCSPFPNVLIAQADLLDLPLAESTFDFVYSIGVLHHTPDPRAAFAQIARCVRPGGRLAVWLYRRNTQPQEWLNSALRTVTTRMPPRALELACGALGVLGAIPLANRTLNKIANFSNHPDWTLRVCDNFDWYAPHFQSHHSLDELKRWFVQENFKDLQMLPPARKRPVYLWAYDHNLIIGSGVNVVGTRAGN
jgi:SAM-dependent methyltransferase